MEYKRNVSFLEARKIEEINTGENSYASVTRKADTTNQGNIYRTFVEKLIQLEAYDWPKFQEHLKNDTRPNFTVHQLSNGLGMGIDPML